MLTALHEERVATLTDLAQVVPEVMKRVRTDLIDHFFWRLTQLLVVVLPLIFFACLGLIWFAKR